MSYDEPRIAPDGSASFEWTHGGHLRPMLFWEVCHTLVVHWPSGRTAKVVTALEGDVGSGQSFGAKWSSDSKAIFIKGWYSGLGCYWVTKGSSPNMNFIYTLEDRVLWQVDSRALVHE
jgi:hypothetical protein